MMRPVVLGTLGAALLCASSASAQTTKLTIAGCTCNMGNNTLAEYQAGFKVSATTVTYTILNTSGAPARTTSVYIHAASATMTGGKPVSECEWQRTGTGTWTALSTVDALVQTQALASAVNSTWNNSVSLRCSLDWVNDPPASRAIGLVFTLKVTP